jgi:hypothetical protein
MADQFVHLTNVEGKRLALVAACIDFVLEGHEEEKNGEKRRGTLVGTHGQFHLVRESFAEVVSFANEKAQMIRTLAADTIVEGLKDD